MRVHVVSAAVIAAGIVSQASAGVTYTSQTRSIEAIAGFPGFHSEFASAPDFATYDDMVEFTFDKPPPEFDSYAFASQRSMLTQAGIFFSGDCHGTDGYGSGGAGSGYGESILDATFVYDGPIRRG